MDYQGDWLDGASRCKLGRFQNRECSQIETESAKSHGSISKTVLSGERVIIIVDSIRLRNAQ
jgi:hypothetical protein